MNISGLGFNKKIEKNLIAGNTHLELARVISVQKESYILSNGLSEYFAKVTGKLLFSAHSSLDFPAVGDWVYFQKFDDDSVVLIHEVLERYSTLKRKTPDKKIDFQIIAANIDAAFIVQSVEKDFNLRRLERYLSMIYDGNIEPVMLLTKSDLLTNIELEEIIEKVKKYNKHLKVVCFSNIIENDFLKVAELLEAEKTYCLIGSSGVGKTSLLNNLVGENKFYTAEIREHDGKGRHSTTSRQLIKLENGSLIIDTPGMRELGGLGISEGIEQTFDEISQLTEKCKFNDCTHISEKGCAVLEALENEELSEERYNSFIKLLRESSYYESSYYERRKKDKETGKLYKSIMKGKTVKGK